jgi:hypothetical protein
MTNREIRETIKKQRDQKEFDRSFALFPVQLCNGETAWLETVCYRLAYWRNAKQRWETTDTGGIPIRDDAPTPPTKYIYYEV